MKKPKDLQIYDTESGSLWPTFRAITVTSTPNHVVKSHKELLALPTCSL